MGSRSNKRSQEFPPSHSSGKTAISGTGALIGRPVEQPRSYEKIARARYEDKQTGRYERYTTKEKASSGVRHVERGSRQVGVRDEFKTSSTVKVGDKSSYTEYQVEERVRHVDFGRDSITNGPNNYASNKIGDSDYESGHHDDDFAPCNDYGDDDAAQFGDCYGGCDDSGDDDVAPNYDCDGGCSNDCGGDVEAPREDCDDFGDDDAAPSDDCDVGCSDDCDDVDGTPSDDCDGGYSDDDDY